MSADLKQAELTIQQMSAEIEALMGKVKVGFQPGIFSYAHVDGYDLPLNVHRNCFTHLTLAFLYLLQATQMSALSDRQAEERRIFDLESAIKSVI